MALFGRKKQNKSEQNADEPKKEKGSWRRPANTAFKQQRLKAWQPILTPRTVLPTFFIIGILFAPIGGLLIWGSGLVTEITIDYTQCDTVGGSPTDLQDAITNHAVTVPKYNYRLSSSESDKQPSSAPQYAFFNDTTQTDVSKQQQCIIQFEVPYDIKPTVLLYYKLTNFYQNHRRYVQSYDADQLKGNERSASDLQSGNCKPVAEISDSSGTKAIYPCGLIANSVFNDTFSNLTNVNPADSADNTANYTLSENGIAWPGESKKYVTKPSGNISLLAPPPNWALRFPDGYNDNNIPDLRADEHFQNWMRTAGLPTFTKLWARNDDDTLQSGTYQIVAYMNFPVKPYSGTKSIVISTVSWIGGKNPFLGWAYVAAASLFVLLAILGTIRHLLKPRRLGDMSLLSWNRQ